MKIGITCYPTYGGSGIIATELGKGLAKKGHEVHFISYSLPARLNHFEERLFYHEVEMLNYPLFEYVPYALYLAAKMTEVTRYQNLDLLHVHYAIPHSISAYLAQQILTERKLKIITTLHGTDINIVGNSPSLLPITKFGIEVSDGVTAVSDFLKNQTYTEFKIKKDIEVIKNFVDTQVFTRVDARAIRKWIAPQGEKIISNIGNFRPVKRVDLAVQIFNRINKEIPCKLILVGDGPERDKVEKTCRELNICSRVYFLGKQDSIVEILSASDLFLFPSESESFGLAALEAMSCEVPVVASRVGGLPEVFDDGEEGFLIEKDDLDGMVERSLEILSNESLGMEMGRKGRIRAQQKYDMNLILKKYEDYYTKIMEG